MINLHTIRPTALKSVDDKTIKQRRNSDTDLNDIFYPHGVIIDEWVELEAISFLKFISWFFNINIFYVFFLINIIK
jgi:hypothetical protein